MQGGSLHDFTVVVDVGKVDAHALLHAWGGDLKHPSGRVDGALDLGDTRDGLKVGHQVFRQIAQRASIDGAPTSLQRS